MRLGEFATGEMIDQTQMQHFRIQPAVRTAVCVPKASTAMETQPISTRVQTTPTLSTQDRHLLRSALRVRVEIAAYLETRSPSLVTPVAIVQMTGISSLVRCLHIIRTWGVTRSRAVCRVQGDTFATQRASQHLCLFFIMQT